MPLCPSHTRRSDSRYGQDTNKCQRRDWNRRPPATGNLQSFRQAELQTFNNTSAKQLHNSRRKETETPRNGSRNPLAFREPQFTLITVDHTFSQKNPIHTITPISLTISSVTLYHCTALLTRNTTWETKAQMECEY